MGLACRAGDDVLYFLALPRPVCTGGNPVTLEREAVAQALPGYDVGEELGRGGWGAVLAGRHRQLGRDVAIKQLPPAFAGDPAVRARFVAEARALAALDHPHVVPIYDYVERDDICLLVMENLPGGTVWHQFTTVGLTMPAVCAVVIATCSGLQSAHLQGILHRDVKPENLMFSATRTLKVTDFGISKVLNGSETKATRAGEVLGTPAYMAPEQVTNRELTPATDVYAVGMMLYELLSGRLPFDAEDPIALLFCQVNDIPPPLSEAAPSVPKALADVCMRALQKNPADRYASAEDMGVALGEAATGAWGPGWLDQSELPVMGTGRIGAVTQRASGGFTGEFPEGGAATGTSAVVSSTRGPAQPTVMPSSGQTYAPVSTVLVRPSELDTHVKGAVAADMSVTAKEELVGVQEVVKLPPYPLVQILTAAALLLVCLAVGFIGLGKKPASSGNIPAGAVSVGGFDPTVPRVIALNLSQPISVTAKPPPGAIADQVRLSFSVGQVPIGKVQASLAPVGNGLLGAQLDAGSFRYIVASRTTTKLTILGAGHTLAQETFKVKSHQSPFLTVPGALAIALVLFTFAYIESLLRSMRRRRKRIVGPAGLLILGALVGVIAVVWAWLLAAVEPTTSTLVVCAVLGAAAGMAAALGAMRIGLRYRIRRGPQPA